MNLEYAERLFEYRKKANLSQEELAEKIGVSRQAVSKWERGEASPDTDNLIALSEVYGVTLDELIKGKQKNEDNIKDNTSPPVDNEKNDRVHISIKDGIHVVDKNGEEVHIDWHGVHVDSGNSHVHVDEKGVFVEENGHIYTKNNRSFAPPYNFFSAFPYPILVVFLHLWFGFANICGGWAYGWLIYLTIPLYYSFISALANHNAHHFAYPVLVVLIYLIGGFKYVLWHPLWLIFFTIPIYYVMVGSIKKLLKK